MGQEWLEWPWVYNIRNILYLNLCPLFILVLVIKIEGNIVLFSTSKRNSQLLITQLKKMISLGDLLQLRRVLMAFVLACACI